jgi:RHS repeat-associated protein
MTEGTAFFAEPYITKNNTRYPTAYITQTTTPEFEYTIIFLPEQSKNTRNFIGKETDSTTGLIYFGARYYDPATGRFISADPFRGDKHDPRSLGRYPYGFNNKS